MRLNLRVDLNPLKEEADREIDRLAEVERLKHITPGHGQAMAYQQKAKEAELVLAGESDVEVIPHIVLEAEINNISVTEQARLVIQAFESWRRISSRIEAHRFIQKRQVAGAQSPTEIKAAIEATDFSFAVDHK